MTTVRTQEYRKTYLFSELKRKLLFRTTLLINPEQPGRANGLFFNSHSKLGVYFTGERSRKQSVTAQNNFHLSHIAAKVTFLNYHFRRHPQDQLSLLPHCDPEMLWLIQQNEIDVSVCSRSIAEPRAQTTAS